MRNSSKCIEVDKKGERILDSVLLVLYTYLYVASISGGLCWAAVVIR